MVIAEKIKDSIAVKKVINGLILADCFLMLYLGFSFEAIAPFNKLLIGACAIFCGLVLLYCLFYGEFVFDSYFILGVSFLACQLISILINFSLYSARSGLLTVIISLFVFEYAVQNRGDAKRLFYTSAGASHLFLLTFLAFYWRDFLSPDFAKRVGVIFGNQNDVGFHLGIAFALNLGIAFSKVSKPFRAIAILMSALSFYAVLLTGSISNTFVCSLVMASSIFFGLPKGKKWAGVIGFISLGIVAFFLLSLPSFEYFKNRISGMFGSFGFGNGKDNSSENRFAGALTGFRLFLQSPLFGFGPEAVYRNFWIMAHNNYAELAADFGILGLIAGELPLIFGLRWGCNKKTIFAKAGLCFFLYLFLFQPFLVFFDSKIVNFLTPILFSFVEDNSAKLFLRKRNRAVSMEQWRL